MTSSNKFINCDDTDKANADKDNRKESVAELVFTKFRLRVRKPRHLFYLFPPSYRHEFVQFNPRKAHETAMFNRRNSLRSSTSSDGGLRSKWGRRKKSSITPPVTPPAPERLPNQRLTRNRSQSVPLVKREVPAGDETAIGPSRTQVQRSTNAYLELMWPRFFGSNRDIYDEVEEAERQSSRSRSASVADIRHAMPEGRHLGGRARHSSGDTTYSGHSRQSSVDSMAPLQEEGSGQNDRGIQPSSSHSSLTSIGDVFLDDSATTPTSSTHSLNSLPSLPTHKPKVEMRRFAASQSYLQHQQQAQRAMSDSGQKNVPSSGAGTTLGEMSAARPSSYSEPKRKSSSLAEQSKSGPVGRSCLGAELLRGINHRPKSDFEVRYEDVLDHLMWDIDTPNKQENDSGNNKQSNPLGPDFGKNTLKEDTILTKQTDPPGLGTENSVSLKRDTTLKTHCVPYTKCASAGSDSSESTTNVKVTLESGIPSIQVSCNEISKPPIQAHITNPENTTVVDPGVLKHVIPDHTLSSVPHNDIQSNCNVHPSQASNPPNYSVFNFDLMQSDSTHAQEGAPETLKDARDNNGHGSEEIADAIQILSNGNMQSVANNQKAEGTDTSSLKILQSNNGGYETKYDTTIVLSPNDVQPNCNVHHSKATNPHNYSVFNFDLMQSDSTHAQEGAPETLKKARDINENGYGSEEIANAMQILSNGNMPSVANNQKAEGGDTSSLKILRSNDSGYETKYDTMIVLSPNDITQPNCNVRHSEATNPPNYSVFNFDLMQPDSTHAQEGAPETLNNVRDNNEHGSEEIADAIQILSNGNMPSVANNQKAEGGDISSLKIIRSNDTGYETKYDTTIVLSPTDKMVDVIPHGDYVIPVQSNCNLHTSFIGLDGTPCERDLIDSVKDTVESVPSYLNGRPQKTHSLMNMTKPNEPEFEQKMGNLRRPDSNSWSDISFLNKADRLIPNPWHSRYSDSSLNYLDDTPEPDKPHIAGRSCDSDVLAAGKSLRNSATQANETIYTYSSVVDCKENGSQTEHGNSMVTSNIQGEGGGSISYSISSRVGWAKGSSGQNEQPPKAPGGGLMANADSYGLKVDSNPIDPAGDATDSRNHISKDFQGNDDSTEMYSETSSLDPNPGEQKKGQTNTLCSSLSRCSDSRSEEGKTYNSDNATPRDPITDTDGKDNTPGSTETWTLLSQSEDIKSFRKSKNYGAVESGEFQSCRVRKDSVKLEKLKTKKVFSLCCFPLFEYYC